MKTATALRFRPRVQLLSGAISEVLHGAPVLAVSGGAILGAVFALAPAHRIAAQQPQQPQQPQALEEITVTGSRIQRQDFTANSPITTIDEASFQSTSTIGVEKVLNELPQFVPALSQFTTTDVQQTANNTIGARTLSLRGLGANRNLVLIDGKRGMPINPTMIIDTNTIPRSAIARVEVITGGASAVYGADAVGGVVNFILKDDFEGASVDIRYGDTEHGGNEEISFSGLLGANVADGRGNVMLGLERSTATKVLQQDRDWRVADMANPRTPATAFGWGSDTWVSSDGTNQPILGTNALNALGVSLGVVQFDNFPDQNYVNTTFNNGQNGSQNCAIGMATDIFASPPPPAPPVVVPNPYSEGVCPRAANGEWLGVPNTARFLLNRPSGTLYTGLMDAGFGGPDRGGARSDLYQGPYDVDHYGNFAGLPFRVVTPDGGIKENNFWQWASGPLERLSAFGKGHFDVSDQVRVTGSAMYTRTKADTSLGLTADLITFWGAAVPFGMDAYAGNPAAGIPNPIIPANPFIPGSVATTHPAYLPGGRFGVNCDAPATAAEPWHDGAIGCTQTEAWPVPLQVWNLMTQRPDPNTDLWISRPPDYIRNAIGASRSGETTSSISNLSLGLEGDFVSGNHSWDLTLSTGRTDSMAVQAGSARLSTYRAMMASPNYGTNAIFDPNPYVAGFAESTPTCTSGLPVIRDFAISNDCVLMLTPDLKNQTNLTQNILEFNLTGDLAQMRAGPLGYALGTSYRENSFSYTPDNLSLNQNFVDPIAGLFPNEGSEGSFDVAELYGELLVPIVSDGPAGFDHFNLELGARMSDWSMDAVDTLASYKTMIDWGFTPNYRLRAGFNRAHRAPNLGELYFARTQIFGGDVSTRGDVCSPRNTAAPWSANTGAFGATPAPGSTAAQAAQTEAICRTLMGVGGAAQYYGNAATQPTLGMVGIQNQLGNADLQEEQADTLTLGLVADVAENWQLSVDYYTIEIEDMIALEASDSIYQRCVSQEFNPTGNANADACQLIFRDPTNGNPSNIDRAYNNEGRVQVEGVDFQVNWNKMLAAGGLQLQLVANYNISSETQDREDLPSFEWAGTNGCALQIQCQGYDYRLFTTVGYFRGNWGMQFRHQYWPSIETGTCVTAPTSTGCTYGLPAGFGLPGVDTDYQLFHLSANFDIRDRYSLRMGIENLFDEEPPMAGGDPTALPYPTDDTHIGTGLAGAAGATYDPLGRRYFISMTMNF
jgi:outer membrane receptor protein involved in Fe transport